MMVAWHEMPGKGTTENPSRRVWYDRDDAFVSSWTVNEFWGYYHIVTTEQIRLRFKIGPSHFSPLNSHIRLS
jgi:hypothetical protein